MGGFYMNMVAFLTSLNEQVHMECFSQRFGIKFSLEILAQLFIGRSDVLLEYRPIAIRNSKLKPFSSDNVASPVLHSSDKK